MNDRTPAGDANPAPSAADVDAIRWDGDGLVAVVIQAANTGAVLTLAYANADALERTLATGSTWLYSRSRRALWNKGATSGHTQRIVSVSVDCDGDALLYRVIPHGPACHTGASSCFSTPLLAAPEHSSTVADADVHTDAQSHASANANANAQADAGGAAFAQATIALAQTIDARRTDPPEGSYTAALLAGGVDRIGKKIGEEATEVVIAAKNTDASELVWESADLIYHLLVLLCARGIPLDAVGAELSRRAAPR